MPRRWWRSSTATATSASAARVEVVAGHADDVGADDGGQRHVVAPVWCSGRRHAGPAPGQEGALGAPGWWAARALVSPGPRWRSRTRPPSVSTTSRSSVVGGRAGPAERPWPDGPPAWRGRDSWAASRRTARQRAASVAVNRGPTAAEHGDRLHAVAVVRHQQQPRLPAGAGPPAGIGPAPLDLGHAPGHRIGDGRARRCSGGCRRLDPHLVGRDEPADGLHDRIGPVGWPARTAMSRAAPRRRPARGGRRRRGGAAWPRSGRRPRPARGCARRAPGPPGGRSRSASPPACTSRWRMLAPHAARSAATAARLPGRSASSTQSSCRPMWCASPRRDHDAPWLPAPHRDATSVRTGSDVDLTCW